MWWRVYYGWCTVGVAPTVTTFAGPVLILRCMKLVASLLVGTMSIRVTRNVLARNRRQRRLLYLSRRPARPGRTRPVS